MPLTSTPTNVVIVLADDEVGYRVYDRDSATVILQTDTAKSSRKKDANALSKLTGWPVVDHD